MLKKIYLEVTNNCNLDCGFCIKNNRNKKFITVSEYNSIIKKIKDYTNYLYFHVSGEPLLHPNINELINLGSKDYKINITTNGYLIKRIINNKNIRQINISLHSYSPKYKVSLEQYLNDIFEVINSLHEHTYFSLRFWINNEYNNKIIEKINEKYYTNVEIRNGFQILNNVYISVNEEFIWPELNNDYFNEKGSCYALKDHIGILVNGDVVPCCLDVNANIKLGNIFNDDLETIFKTDRVQKMLKGFSNNVKYEEFCKKCNFYEVCLNTRRLNNE